MMNRLDNETMTALKIRKDELCCDLKLDVMRELALLRAATIILESFFKKKIPPKIVTDYAIYLSKYEE